MDKDSLLIVDDHDIVVLGLKHVVQTHFPDTFEVDSAKSGREALRKIAETRYDLYIIDLELADMTGFEVIEGVRQRYANAKIIVHTQHDELWYHRKLNAFHVDGVCLKSSDSQHIVNAIRGVMNGNTYHDADNVHESNKSMKCGMLHGKDLSEREMAVLNCIAQGMSTNEMAEELCISVNTVETHRRHLNEKLSAKNTASLIMHAVKCGLLTVF